MLASAAAACPADGEIVEIGSFRGLSTIVLATHAPEGAAVVAIDPHAGNDRGPRELDGYAEAAAADRIAFERNLASRRSPPPGSSRQGQLGATPTVTSTARSTCCTSTEHTATDRRGQTSATGAGASPSGGTLLIHDAFSSVGVTAAILRELVFGRRFRYVGRSRSLAQYRADLAGAGSAGASPQRRRPALPSSVGSPATSPSRCC